MRRPAIVLLLALCGLGTLAAQQPLVGRGHGQGPGPASTSQPGAVPSCPSADSVVGMHRTFGIDLITAMRNAGETYVIAKGPRTLSGPDEGLQFLEGTVRFSGTTAVDPEYEFIANLRERHELPIEERQLSFRIDDTIPVSVGSMSMHVDASPLTPGILMVNLYAMLDAGVFRRLAAARKVEMTLGSQKRKLDSRERDQIAAAYAAAVCGVQPS